MVNRAVAAGIKAKWLIGYGIKTNIALALDNGLHALFLMKRARTNYRVDGKLYKAKDLYQLFRRRMQPVAGGSFRSFAFNAEINLNKKKTSLTAGFRCNSCSAGRLETGTKTDGC